MRNLFRMDLYRMLRSKGFYICLSILGFYIAISFFLIFSIGNPSMREKIESIGIHFTVTNEDAAVQALASSSMLEVFYQSSGIRGGMFACIIGILASIFICTEYESGFVKNVFLLCENKWNYILSKQLILGFVNFIYLTFIFLLLSLLNLITGNFFVWNDGKDILFFLISIWILETAFSSLYLVIIMVTRKVSASVASGIFLGSGTIFVILSSILGLFGWDKFLHYTLSFSLINIPLSYSGLASLQPLFIGLAFLIIYTIFSVFVVQKRDV